MKLGVITSRFPPETSPGAKRAADLVRALNEAGHQAVILTQYPTYPDPAAFGGLDGVEPVTVEDDEQGNTTWRFRPRLVSKKNLPARLLAEARFALRASRLGTRLSGLDGLVASTPFIFNLVAARTYRRPMWLDVRDLTWEYARRFGPGSALKRVGARFLKSLSLSSLRAAMQVSTTTERQRQYLIQNGVPEERVSVVPNGVPRSIAEELGRRSRDGITNGGGPLRVVYAGLLGFPQGLSFAVRGVEELAGSDVELHLYGEGVDRMDLARYCGSRGLRHVHLHGHVDHGAYLDALAGADVLYASLRPGAEAAMPSKIWEYMAAGKPVLFGGRGEAAEAIECAQAGLSCDYGDHAALRRRLQDLSDAGLRHELGDNGRRWVLGHRVREDINVSWVRAIEAAFGGAA